MITFLAQKICHILSPPVIFEIFLVGRIGQDQTRKVLVLALTALLMDLCKTNGYGNKTVIVWFGL